MIKLTLKNVASFGEAPVILEINKKVNLIYGLNGTGKTTLSDFLYYGDQESRFKDCILEGGGDTKILVYSQNFIKDNFHDKDELKGIFTLSKENKVAEHAVNQAIQEKQNHENEKTKKTQTKEETKNEKVQELEKIKGDVWAIKITYTGGDRVLGFCLDGLQKKELLFSHISKLQKPDTKPDKTIEELKQEAQFISEENVQKRTKLELVKFNVENIEQDQILSEVIVGNEDSPVSRLIKTLNNSDWVKQGIKYLPDDINENTEQCPFCQQKTITRRISHDIRAYFDEFYEEKIKKIRELKSQYEQMLLPLQAVKNDVNGVSIQNNKDQFENIYNQVENSLNENCLKIQSKLKEPSQKITLVDTENKLNSLNDFIAKANQEIQQYNQTIDNREEIKEKIRNVFWQNMRCDYNDQLTQYYQKEKSLTVKIKNLEEDISNINNQIEIREQEIVKQQKNMINIEGAISNINNGLTELGIDEFSIKEYNKYSYRIVRDGQNNWEYSTLSEGEKMIISFLYFMELCKGKERKEEVEKDKIVVIDDPISSLSHTYIFNLSQWIKKHFFDGNYKKVLILTHNLYFFHELISCATNKAFFRITKSSSTCTQIQAMQQDEIKNEYESYWQVIKDHDDHRASDFLLANSMRNILEHFFGFLGKGTLSENLTSLGGDREFVPFLRYMNRESHSDAINITDNKEIDPKLFKNAFKKVFTKCQYKEHYKSMMDKK